MAKKIETNIITGLDIGTSKIIALIGEVKSDGTIEIIGIGRHPSRGLKRGVVVDIETTVNSIQRAVQEAELMANCEVAQCVYRYCRIPYSLFKFSWYCGYSRCGSFAS